MLSVKLAKGFSDGRNNDSTENDRDAIPSIDDVYAVACLDIVARFLADVAAVASFVEDAAPVAGERPTKRAIVSLRPPQTAQPSWCG